MSPSNVILITIDALRADHLPFMGYQRNTSPFLQEIARRGTVFPLAFANSSFTWASFPALFSSDYPVQGSEYTIEGRILIQEILQDQGYQTATFHSNPYLSRYYKYDRGFSYFEDYINKSLQTETNKKRRIASKLLREHHIRKAARFVEGFEKRHDIAYNIFALLRKIVNPEMTFMPYVDALRLTNDVLSWSENRSKKPFFLWVHYMDTHEPHVYPRLLNDIEGPPVNKRELKSGLHRINASQAVCANYLGGLISKYDARIRFVDLAIEVLFSRLTSDIIDNSLIIITADHGEEFFDHGHLGHQPKLYDELIHVPLIIKGVGIPQGKRVNTIVQHLDIAPTILDLLGIPIPKSFLGKNIFKLTEREGVISETSSDSNKIEIVPNKLQIAYRTKDRKYIYRRNADDEFYDLETDSKETKNLLPTQRERAEELKSRVLQHIALRGI